MMNKPKLIPFLTASLMLLLCTTMATSAFSYFSFRSESIDTTTFSLQVEPDNIKPDEPEMIMHNLNESDGYNPSEMGKRHQQPKTKKTSAIEADFNDHNL